MLKYKASGDAMEVKDNILKSIKEVRLNKNIIMHKVRFKVSDKLLERFAHMNSYHKSMFKK